MLEHSSVELIAGIIGGGRLRMVFGSSDLEIDSDEAIILAYLMQELGQSLGIPLLLCAVKFPGAMLMMRSLPCQGPCLLLSSIAEALSEVRTTIDVTGSSVVLYPALSTVSQAVLGSRATMNLSALAWRLLA